MELTLNGARIHYERAGSGIPVIMLHAGVADHRMWQPQVAPFSKDFDVITPDMRGFGESTLPTGPWSGADDVEALIDELELKPAHVVGCSIGGSVAIDFALQHPERISRLVVVGPGVSGMKMDEKHESLWQEVVEADKAGDMDALNRAEMYLWLDGRRPRGYVKEPLRRLFLDMNGGNLDNDFEASPRQQLEPPAVDRLQEITAPTLVVVGDADLPTIFDAVDLLTEKLPNARKVVIQDAAHLPNLEHPEEFNRAVLDFLLED
jgi:2-hydroxy-6-oxonona-2,4-dienedioate hydrolase